jgi:MFS family permease
VKNFPLFTERRNIFLYYVLTAAISCFFIASNWIYFWTKYMTYGQLGWVDALGFGFALLLEVPSGAIADLLGKKKTIIFGMISGAVGVGIITFSGSLTGIFIGWLITQIAFAFFSGAGEALAYDTLVDLKEEENFDKVITRSSEIESWTAAITILIGGFLYAYNFRLPHILWGLGFVVGAVFAFLLVEPKVDTEKFSFKKYFNQLFLGIKELTQTGLRRYIGFFFALVGIYYMYSWGFIRPAMGTAFGFFSREQAIILPALTILGAILVRSVPFLKSKFSNTTGLVILSILMALGFILASFPIGYYGIISMIAIAIAGKLASPWISILVNKRIESKNRATTLSTVALMTKIPYVLVAITAGKLIEEGKLGIFNLTTGLIVIAITIGSLLIIAVGKLKTNYEK